MILRCVFALQRALILMMSLYNCWNYNTSNEDMKDISILLYYTSVTNLLNVG
jgi:hypothetical protein